MEAEEERLPPTNVLPTSRRQNYCSGPASLPAFPPSLFHPNETSMTR